MKKNLSLLLSVIMFLVYGGICAPAEEALPTAAAVIEVPALDEDITDMDDPRLLQYVEESVQASLDNTFPNADVVVEEVSAVYISKEYLEETAYNSRANIFFGFTLADLNAAFDGTRYVFTCDENGQTVVREFIEIPNDTYDQIIKNVAIGAGVILVCVVVTVVTRGQNIKMPIFFSTSASKIAAYAVVGSIVNGVATAVVKGVQTDDFNETVNAAALAASEGFRWGVIAGALPEGIDDIVQNGCSYLFKEGSTQAK